MRGPPVQFRPKSAQITRRDYVRSVRPTRVLRLGHWRLGHLAPIGRPFCAMFLNLGPRLPDHVRLPDVTRAFGYSRGTATFETIVRLRATLRLGLNLSGTKRRPGLIAVIFSPDWTFN